MTQKVQVTQLKKDAKPFLRWAGGKKWFCKYIDDFIPQNFNNYHELFLGSGSIFFHLPEDSSKEYYLSDLNEDLVNAFIQIRDQVSCIIQILKTFRNDEKFYYKIRSRQFDPDPVFRAARLVYLNKLGYNGIYRVNSKGEYNVPYGHRANVDFVDELNLYAVSRRLQKVFINPHDFETSLKAVRTNDLVFLDPPYTVAHEENGFIEYNQKIFSLEDQIRLAESIKKIHLIDAYYILTNAKHKKILEIYSSLGKPKILVRHCHIGGIGAVREDIKEYVFTNCF